MRALARFAPCERHAHVVPPYRSGTPRCSVTAPCERIRLYSLSNLRVTMRAPESDSYQLLMTFSENRGMAVLFGSLVVVAAATALLYAIPNVNPTTVALILLLVVLGTATLARLRTAIVVA